MKALDNSKIAHVDSDGYTFTFMSFERDGEAMVLFAGGESWSNRTVAGVEISASEAAGALKALGHDDFDHGFTSPTGEHRLRVTRANRGEPYCTGFEIEVSQQSEYGHGYLSRDFGGFFEDDYRVDRIKEIFQHCVDLDQKLKAESAGPKP